MLDVTINYFDAINQVEDEEGNYTSANRWFTKSKNVWNAGHQPTCNITVGQIALLDQQKM